MTIKLLETATPPSPKELTPEDIDFNHPGIYVFITCCAVLVDSYHAIRLLQIESSYISPMEQRNPTPEEHSLKRKIIGVGVRNLKRTFFRQLVSLEQHTDFGVWRKQYKKYKEEMSREYEVKK